MTVKRSGNPLALAVLALLFERDMHPYEMATTLRERRKEESIKLRYGSLYTVIERLQENRLIAARETRREGRRPARTIYAITSAGEAAMREWMTDLLGKPAKEYPRFEAALSLMPVLPPDEVARLLQARAGHLDDLKEQAEASIAEAQAMNLPELFVVETRYSIACLQNERDFVLALAARIRDGSLDGADFWRSFHETQRGRNADKAFKVRAEDARDWDENGHKQVSS